MTDQPGRRKRNYTSVYVIYRRLRFVRHRRKSLKKLRKEQKLRELAERQQIREQFSDHVTHTRLQTLDKARAERAEARRIKQELAAEARERRELMRVEMAEQAKLRRERMQSEKVRIRLERKRLMRFYFRSRIKGFFRSFRTLTPRNIRHRFAEFRRNAPIRRQFVVIALNSTALFLAAYLFLFLVSQAVTVLTASFFDYPTIVYYYEIYFNISPEAWYHDSVKTIFSSGPLVNMAIGISFLIIYHNIRELPGMFKLFFLWGFLHAVNMLFGAMLVGTLFETGVGHVISWMYVMDTGKLMYSIVSIFVLVMAGLMTTRSFLISANSYFNEINENNRSFFMVPQVFIPYLAGNLILIALRQPKFVYYDTFVALTMILPILPVLLSYRSYHELFFEEEQKTLRISWVSLLILVLFMLIFRGLLSLGIRFPG